MTSFHTVVISIKKELHIFYVKKNKSSAVPLTLQRYQMKSDCPVLLLDDFCLKDCFFLL